MGKGTYRGGSTLIRIWHNRHSSKRVALMDMLKGALTQARKREAIAAADAALRAKQEAASAARKAARVALLPHETQHDAPRGRVLAANARKVVVERRKLLKRES